MRFIWGMLCFQSSDLVHPKIKTMILLNKFKVLVLCKKEQDDLQPLDDLQSFNIYHEIMIQGLQLKTV